MGGVDKEQDGTGTFLDDLKSLLGELFASQGVGNRGDGQAFAPVLVLDVVIVFAVASHGGGGGHARGGRRGRGEGRSEGSARSATPLE